MLSCQKKPVKEILTCDSRRHHWKFLYFISRSSLLFYSSRRYNISKTFYIYQAEMKSAVRLPLYVLSILYFLFVPEISFLSKLFINHHRYLWSMSYRSLCLSSIGPVVSRQWIRQETRLLKINELSGISLELIVIDGTQANILALC